MCFRSNISETVRDIWVTSSAKIKDKSRATRRYKCRLCSCYRFRDIRVVIIMNFECWPIRPSRFKKPSNDSSYGLIIRIKKYRVQGSCFRSNISKTIRDIWVPFAAKIKGKSRAIRRYKRRLCSCYRFRDIRVVIIMNFECWPIRAL